MNLEKFIDPEITNLKNYFNYDKTSGLLLRHPHIMTSGYLINDPEWSSEPHIHDFAEIIFCADGRGQTSICNQVYDIGAGDLILMNPNLPHHESSDPDHPLEFFFVGITDFQISGLPANMLHDENTCRVQKTGQYKDQFETFFEELTKETVYREVHYQHLSEAICSCILALVIRILDGAEPTQTSSFSPHSIRIKEYIDNNFTSSGLNLAQLSSAVYISQTYVSHIFKADLGVSPIQYLINKRIAFAKHLLATDEMPIAQIAVECGYDDPVYFTQVFRRITGTSPTAYRQSHKKG